MSNGSGVTQGDINAAVASLRSEIYGELQRLESHINRVEAEVAELARAVIHAINEQTEKLAHQMALQTAAVVGGIAATTVMLERTKNQLESDFKETRSKLELQTETEL